MIISRDAVSRSAQGTFWKKFLGNLQKLLKIFGFSYVLIHFSPTARTRSVRESTVLITSVTHSLKSIALNRRSLLALPPSRLVCFHTDTLTTRRYNNIIGGNFLLFRVAQWERRVMRAFEPATAVAVGRVPMLTSLLSEPSALPRQMPYKISTAAPEQPLKVV